VTTLVWRRARVCSVDSNSTVEVVRFIFSKRSSSLRSWSNVNSSGGSFSKGVIVATGFFPLRMRTVLPLASCLKMGAQCGELGLMSNEIMTYFLRMRQCRHCSMAERVQKLPNHPFQRGRRRGRLWSNHERSGQGRRRYSTPSSTESKANSEPSRFSAWI